jgi:uracil-DNA glycosylase
VQASTLDLVREQNKMCTRCSLRAGCNQVTTGIGPINATLLVCGEASGADEDIEGEPFVGRSGQLLTKLLKDAGISRTDIYISNAVKCRPPNNRVPTQEELDTCKIWLWKEIQLLQNLKVILTLGATPTALLLKLNNIVMSTLIGRSFTVSYTKAKLIPWYHPSFLLRRNKPVNGNEDKLIERTVACFIKIKEQL